MKAISASFSNILLKEMKKKIGTYIHLYRYIDASIYM